MIPFKTQIGNFEIANSFEDITVEDLLYFKECKDEPIKIFERMTGLPKEKLCLLDLDPLVIHLAFLQSNILENIAPFNEIEIDGNTYQLPEDIGEETWGQKLLSNQAIRQGNPIEVLSIYLQPLRNCGKFDEGKVEEINELLYKLDVVSVYSAMIFITNQLKDFAEKEAKLLKSDVSFEQKAAGIAMFNQLGDFNTIDMIAGGDPLKYEKVLAIDYNTIFNKLLHIKITAKFEKRYHEIINKRK